MFDPQWANVWVQATVGVMATAVGVVAWLTSVSALRSTYRPVLRPVPTFIAHRVPRAIEETTVKVKNIGTGPAVAVMLVDASAPEKILGELNVVEPLGPATESGEAGRVGNVNMILNRGLPLLDTHTYRLLYQDLGGRWHETRFTIPADENAFAVRFLGQKHWWHVFRGESRVPRVAKARGQVATA